MVYGNSTTVLWGALVTTTDPLFDLAVVEDPHSYFAQLRETDPVHLIAGTNTYLVTRLDLIHEVVGDPSTYSSNTNAFLHVSPDGTPGLRDALGDEPTAAMSDVAVLATADPPKHTTQRRILMPLFSKNALARREDEFRQLVDRALDAPLDAGGVEWMSGVAEPLPAVMVARLLGLDDGVAPFLKETGFASVEQIGGFVPEDRRGELRDLMTRLGPVGDAYMGARDGHGPGPDTVLGVVVAAVDAGEMDDLEAIGTLMLIVSAGTESTTSLLGTGARVLAEREDLQQQLRDDPELIETFIEEMLRFDPPFRGHYRRVTRATTLEGVAIPADARLILVWPAANRDNAGFDAPDEIRLDRAAPRQHVGFGWGIHLCLGAPLARLEARVTFERLLGRTSNVRIEPSSPPLQHHRSLMIRRLTALPLLLDRR
jgi:cytochrome P450